MHCMEEIIGRAEQNANKEFVYSRENWLWYRVVSRREIGGKEMERKPRLVEKQ